MSINAVQLADEARSRIIENILLNKYGAIIDEGCIAEIIGTNFYHGLVELFFLLNNRNCIKTSDLVRYIAKSKQRSVRFFLAFFPYEELPNNYQDAIYGGYPIYMTKTACQKGHTFPRGVSSRQCLACRPAKLADRMIQKDVKHD